MKRLGQQGATPVLVLVAIIGIIGFLAIAFGFSFKGNNQALFPKTEANAAGNSPCQFQKADQPLNIALCETFDAPKGNGGRSGDLDPVLWGVSRIGGDSNVTQGGKNAFETAHLVGCGVTQAVTSPRDVQVCNGHVYEAVNDSEYQTTLAMYPKQPFDIAGGRTGTVVFDVTADSEGEHAAWPEFWWSDQPVPAPHGEISSQLPAPRNGFGIVFTACDGVTTTGPRKLVISRNYVPSDQALQGSGCVTKGSAATGKFNHFEVRINVNRVEIWGSDAGSTNLRLLGSADNLNLPLTRGVVWLEDLHYNADKFNDQRDHTFAWDNLGFDGPAPYRDLSFDVPIQGSTQGWSMPHTFQTDPVYWTQTPTSVLAVFNWWPWSNAVPDVRVNGGPWHSTPWIGGDTFAWRTVGVTIPFSEVIQGSNKLEFKSADGNSMLANINLIMIAGASVPGVTAPSPSPALSPSPGASVSSKPGDINGDNKVNLQDYNILLSNFGKSGVGVAGGDLDGSGRVGIQDFNILLANFGM